MPSIFIWKANTPFTPTVKTISYYAGSNWFLEDYGSHSKSGMYIDQATLSEDGMMYTIQWMPSDWVGSYVLEQTHVPYSLIRVLEWGTLERIGNWMRFITKHDVSVDEREYVWKQIRELEEEPCLINIAMGMGSMKSLQYSPNHSPKRFYPKRANQFTDVQTHV
jgi:hypothetical protein